MEKKNLHLFPKQINIISLEREREKNILVLILRTVFFSNNFVSQKNFFYQNWDDIENKGLYLAWSEREKEKKTKLIIIVLIFFNFFV